MHHNHLHDKNQIHQHHNHWEGLKDLLKEKLQHHPSGNEQKGADAYWNRFEEITGKSKEEIKTELRRF